MTKLILEAVGRRREFRLGEGRLTLGSGADATVTVESGELAEVHLDLEVSETQVRITPRAGVLPPKLGGVPHRESFALAPGKVLTIGSVKLWIELEGEVTGPPVVSRGRSGKRRPGGAARRATPRAKGPPTWAVGLGALALAGLGFLFVKRGLLAEAKSGAPIGATLAAIDQHLREGHLDIAEEKLDAIHRGKVSAEADARIRELRRRLEEERALRGQDSANLRGEEWFKQHLEHYESKWLVGSPAVPKVRLFLERCQEFRERWPTHPRLEWIERQERRFQGHVDLRAPRTWADIEWALEYLVNQPTRNYARALELVDEFVARAEGAELLESNSRRDALLAERERYHREKMADARREFEENDDAPQAVWWLVHLTIWIGDEAMADEAARTLARIPDVESHLRGYAQRHPGRLTRLLEHSRLAGFAGALEDSQ